MSEQELNSYRFASGQEPGDDRLRQIMSEVCSDAISRQKKAEKDVKEAVAILRQSLREKWEKRILTAANG